jgi:hypothetical protein
MRRFDIMALKIIYGLFSAFLCCALLYEMINIIKNPEILNNYVGDRAFLPNILYLSSIALWFLLGAVLPFLKKRNKLLNAIFIIHVSVMIIGIILICDGRIFNYGSYESH